VLAPLGLTLCFFILSKNARSLMVNSGSRLRWSSLQRALPNAGPISQPKKVAPKVAMPMLTKGSVGMSLVTASAKSGYSESATNAAAVVATEPTIEEVREYRRREVRRRKNVFQSRMTDDDAGGLDVLGRLAVRSEACEALVDDDAWRLRHNEGVKTEEAAPVHSGRPDSPRCADRCRAAEDNGRRSVEGEKEVERAPVRLNEGGTHDGEGVKRSPILAVVTDIAALLS